MTQATSLIRYHFEECLGIVRQASLQILPLLSIRITEGKDPQSFFQQFEQARLTLGSWEKVASRLNLNDVEISQFTLLLRQLQQQVPQYESGQTVSHDQLIAILRFVRYLEHVRDKQPLLTYSTELAAETEAEQQQAIRQVYALEQMLKGIIQKAYPSQPKLISRLKKRWGIDKVREWVKQGNSDDILSGMRFSDLALMIIDSKEFTHHYAGLFRSLPPLSFLNDQRETLQTYLNDIRQMRNDLMGQQSLSSVQIAALGVFFQEIRTPVQNAFNQGKIRVNPAALLEVSDQELQSYLQQEQQKQRQYPADDEDLKESIDPPHRQYFHQKADVNNILFTVLWGLVGVAVLGLLGLAFYMYSETTKQNRAATTSSTSASPPPGTSDGSGQIRSRPTSSSARQALANRGITWDENNLRTAIDRNDASVVKVFMQGGMPWKVSFTEQALAYDNRDVLGILLQNRQLMDEDRPCRRLITTTAQAMHDKQTLTSHRKQFLKTFCRSDYVVSQQKVRLDNAQARLAAQKQRYQSEVAQGESPAKPDEQEVSIQKAIYDVIR